MSKCWSCNAQFKTVDEKVKGDNGLTFHRTCLKKILEIKPEMNDQEASIDYLQTAGEKGNSFVPSSYTKQTNEEQWECKDCSTRNSQSEKRCQSCAKPRFTRHSSFMNPSYASFFEEPSGYSPPLKSCKNSDDDTHIKPVKKCKGERYNNGKHSYGKIDEEDNESKDNSYGDPRSFPRHRSPSPSVQPKWKDSQASSSSSLISKNTDLIYIPDLPSDITNNYDLEQLISRRIEDLLQIKLRGLKCYSKLGIGVIHITDNKLKDRLLNKVGRLALDPKDGKYNITFVDSVDLISYVILEINKDFQNDELPSTTEVSRRWVDMHKGETPLSCDVLNVQFPNIYRIAPGSLDELVNTSYNGVFRIKDFLGCIYYCADYAIALAIGQTDLPSTALYVQIHKESATACVISANMARLWSTKSFITIDKNTLQKRIKLACRLIVHPIPKAFSIQSIIKHKEFRNTVTYHKLTGDHLILELSDRSVFDQFLEHGALRLDDDHIAHMNLCNTLNNPDGGEIDDDTWYETEMLQIKPDIMYFVANPQNKIFRLRWNSHIWNEEFKRVATQKRDSAHSSSQDHKNPTSDQMRHLLRVTVMLNTLAVIQERTFMIDEREIQLNLKNELKTVVYDHESTLERREKLALTKTLYSRTTIRVVRGDCLIEYERMVKMGKRPVLLNTASATNPGGGFRKGDGAQEENIFRRSDYCRSLDIGLDEFLKERADRLHCSSDCRLDRISDPSNMYPMDEFGAIYTTGITVFRQPEEMGYAFMEKPLENVCAIAMAAYRDPELKGTLLAPKYAVGTRKKIENIFAIAHQRKHDCLILSALGCGAFKNPPEHVAKLFYSVIEQYAGFFDMIVFAIIDDHNAGRLLNPEGNFQPFANILDNRTVEPTLSMNKANTIIGPYRLLSDGLTVSNVTIFDQTPCFYGAKCTEMYNVSHSNQFSHPPLCIQAAIDGKCRKIDDIVHTTSFIHRNQCREGGLCRQVNDENHNREFEHPDYCPDEGRCQNEKDDHLKQYRHLPLCEKAHKCMEYQKEVVSHCNRFRYCAPRCPHGEFLHPFATPCPRTPFDCPCYIQLSGAKDIRSIAQITQSHCIKYAHICKNGRNCTDNTPLHLSKTIHIARQVCPYLDKCKQLDDEEHLNSFSHPNVSDIRPACRYNDKCHDLHKFDHKVSLRHPSTSDNGVVQYYGSNEKTDFVQNQKDNIACVQKYIIDNKWTFLSLKSIPREILNWVRTVQPIHRCSPIIFESILLHGHVMSREYMEHLKDPIFVANSILHHPRIRRIEELNAKACEDDAKLFVTALVGLEFEKNGFTKATVVPPAVLGVEAGKDATSYSAKEIYEHIMKRKENRLTKMMSDNHLTIIRTKAIEIAQSSIKLHSHPAGIGHLPDKALGNDKLVFSILGPHLGHYYGDIIIVFKREILHHPDANYSIQAATSFASGNAYKWRPWLGTDSCDLTERIKHYHRTKLHASVPGYDYATALELIALTNLRKKSTSMDVTLQEILDQWVRTDSHHNIEAHLPQLIPFDYIDHIFIPKNLFDALSENTLKTMDALFKHCTTPVSHDGNANHEKAPFGPTPTTKSREEYQNVVVKVLRDRYTNHITRSLLKPIQGVVITIPSSNFDDHYVLPLTIPQAYVQDRIDNHRTQKDNIVCIYWKAMHGDMMLTLSNEEISSSESQPNLRCLICYIGPKPAISDDDYHEHTSYLAAAHPFQHEMILNKKSYKAKSNTFYLGCNSSDFMTFCLRINRSTAKVILSHAGPNGIYNHEEISCTFGKSELDLTKMEFIHVSAGIHAVPIRNLIICFEKQSNMHPTFDKDYKRDTSNVTEKESNKIDDNPSKKPGFLGKIGNLIWGNNDTSIRACPDNVNCLKQYSNEAKEHNTKFSHPCPYSERCRDKDSHPTYIHELHDVSKCRDDEACNQLDDPLHRASYRHTGRPDFLITCRRQKECTDTSSYHRKKYSHGEEVFEILLTTISKIPLKHDERILCKWGLNCYNNDADHRARFSHPK
ncbi:hypothetical protein I4U23_015558 [Adineta vaga]|nr:hypothetical protein I4U23_015558 [Adineta vaga]